ncbi:Distinct helicase family with a unique C-terminal domain including a metal-binding cysteine cluster [Rubrobacter radiotolerans]|uniref:Distinct helicase family with a unique C-terminal domain including a metal-binding cysteine cluster n=1 Tax=Rubrobacter radiotolerans TaxID=42256 RepID=A0A023X157_RUBRA|nr:DEAD/DEAH box helicase [Rubrobacter radiotolerans]AHY45750.1 Distinct helicase family with a unique C-terminal domain including a metal-binding cysteine cluster [Rubrobacter radiotolerans]MDX5893166.1 Zn-binding domain-containing protein [Rubrobacter radiotolerans]SMC03194.1 DEAD/DEAH box helicase domain-containing protein [Rubrobacter radiotolerans DSM 5868]
MSRRAVAALGETVASLPAKSPDLADLPPDLDERLAAALRREGVLRMYTHQREAHRLVREGENVVVATATASGKSLCYKVPAFEAALQNVRNRSLFLYPTKALSQDQLGKIRAYDLPGVHAATYDGDTPRSLRPELRRRANVLLTNPDMLSLGILPNHEAWSAFFRNLKVVAVDEAHVLRGVFGSHVAAVLRRLRRVANLHGSEPRFVLTSATIANPQDLAESLVGEPFSLVDRDGASSGPRRVVFRNPPLLDKEKGERRSLLTEGALVFAALVASGVRTIAFARTRKAAEIIYRHAADRLGVEGARCISPYRAGYTARERRDIESRLFRGELLGVVSTNALELGVDVGTLDAVVCCGYPGSIASIWQQWGRAGRGKEPSLSVYIAGRDALDQFLFENPKRVLGRRVEAARVTMENPYILAPHLLAAAHEAPLEAEDERYFGPEFGRVAGELARDGDLVESGGRLVYAGGESPAGRISLRSASGETVVVADAEGELIGTAEASRAPSELHPGATYLHRGAAFEVADLDLHLKRAVARRVPNQFHTRPRVETDVEIIEEVEERPLANGATLHRGFVRTTDTVTHYKKVRIADDREVGVFPLDLPDVTLTTQAMWLTLPAIPRGARPSFESFGGALHAAEHAMIGLLPLFAMCDRADIGGLSTPTHRQTRLPTIFVYDGYPGGVGISERGFEAFRSLARDTLGVITRCPCERGCPACIQSPKCGNWNEPLSKGGAVEVLRFALGQVSHYPTLGER